MPHLSPETRKRILEQGARVYSAYAALNLATDPRTQIKFDGRRFNEVLQTLIQKKEEKITHLESNGAKYKIELVLSEAKGDESNKLQVKITQIIGEQEQNISPPSETKPLDQYTPAEAMALWANQPFLLNPDQPLQPALELQDGDQTHRIGGNKINLYSIHIRNLYELLQRLKNEHLPPHALIEMATGSGKSFTQALWWMVLHLAKVPAVFSVPSAAHVKQLVTEFSRLLPNSFSKKADVITHEELFIKRWPALNKTTQQDYFVVVDEQHEAMEDELFAGRLTLLSQTLPLLLLSATPTESVHKILTGSVQTQEEKKEEKTVIHLSLSDKLRLGLAQGATTISSTVQRVCDRFNRSNSTWKQRLMLAIAETLEPERTSAAHHYVEQVETHFSFREPSSRFYVPTPTSIPTEEKKKGENKEELRQFLRWNLTSPLGERALVHATSHDAIVNLSILTNGDTRPEKFTRQDVADAHKQNLYKEDAYRWGNRVPREDVFYSIHAGENLDKVHHIQHAKRLLKKRKETVLNWVSSAWGLKNNDPGYQQIKKFIEDTIDFGSHRAYLDYRVCHGLLEKALEFLTGKESVQLDEMRRHSFQNLLNEVKDALTKYSSEDDFSGLEKNLKPELKKWLRAQGLKTTDSPSESIVILIIAMIHMMISYAQKNEPLLQRMVDNWPLDKVLHDEIFGRDEETWRQALNRGGVNDIVSRTRLKTLFVNYLQKHRTVFVMKGLVSAENPIPEGKPFYKLEQKATPLDVRTTKRSLGIYEQMNPHLFQFNYDATLLEKEAPRERKREAKTEGPPSDNTYSVDTVDSLFKLGLIGCYVSSEKVSGFNDPNLQHVGVLVDSNDDVLNQPNMMIQAVGRNRGLNPARSPISILSADYGVTLVFDPKQVEQEGAHQAIRKARRLYHQQLLTQLKINLSQEIQNYIEQEMDAEGEIDENALEERCIQILLNGFESLYKVNEYDFTKTRGEFIGLLQHMQTYLVQKTEEISNTYRFPVMARIVAVLSNTLARLSLIFKTFTSRIRLREALAQARESATDNQKVYAHLIQQYNYKAVSRTLQTGEHLKNLFFNQAKAVMLKVAKTPSRYLKPNAENPFEEHFKNTLAPSMLQHVKSPEHRAAIQALIHERQKPWLDLWLQWAKENQSTLDNNIDENNVFSLAFEKIFKPVILMDPEIAAYVEEQAVDFDGDYLKNKKTSFEKRVNALEEKGKEMKQAQTLLSKNRGELEKLAKKEIARVQNLIQWGQNGLQEVKNSYAQELMSVGKKVQEEKEKFFSQHDPNQQKDVISKVGALWAVAKFRVFNSSDSVNTFFKKNILRTHFLPLLDRQSQAVLTRILNNPRYDWSKPLLQYREDGAFLKKPAIEQLQFLTQQTFEGHNKEHKNQEDPKDQKEFLYILNQFIPPQQSRHKSKGKEPPVLPMIVKTAAIERMEEPLRERILPALLDGLFNDEDKAFLESVLQKYTSKGNFLIRPQALPLLEAAEKLMSGAEVKGEASAPERRLEEGRKLLTQFFCTLVPPEEKDKEKQIKQIEAIMATVPLSKTHAILNDELQKNIFPTLARLMTPQREGQKFLELTARYKTWGRALAEMVQENRQEMDDPEKAFCFLIDKAVSDGDDRQSLKALIATNNEQGIKKKLFIQFFTEIADDVLALLPDHSVVKKSYTTDTQLKSALPAKLGAAFDKKPDILDDFEESKGDKMNVYASKLDSVVALLHEVAQPQPSLAEDKSFEPETPKKPFQQMITAFKESRAFIKDLENNIDPQKIRGLLIQKLQPIIADPVYKDCINTILGPLNREQLKTILKAIDPSEEKEQQAAHIDLLMNFKRDLNRLSSTQVIEQYFTWDETVKNIEIRIQQSDFIKVTTLAFKILAEVRCCQENFYGKSGDSNTPKLKESSDPSSSASRVWKPCTADTERHLSIQDMKAFTETYGPRNRLAVLSKQKHSQHSINVARKLGCLGKNIRKGVPINPSSDSPFTLFAHQLRNATSLSAKEIADDQAPDRSAVHKLRRTLKQSLTVAEKK